MSAVMLRDMRTRFFDHGLGFIIVPLWPLVHMAIIIAIHSFAHPVATYGDSVPVFFMTGVLPFLLFSYISRFMAFSLLTNKSMLAFPVVKISDILMGRAALEIIAAFLTLFSMLLLFYAWGDNPFPADWESATECYLATIYLAFGCGYFVGICALIYPVVLTIFQLTIITLYVSSGVFFVPSNLPDEVSKFLFFNPITQCIEWFRTAYYESYSDKLVSVPYVIGYATITLMAGLLLERSVARHISDR
ncbi:capsular biosynthesis protein [Rhizobium sp. CNPSo 4039]|uniref:ABC transporter permease n=1 Tax=Rhizobium sp. CNPSo 4039 TaxID=3021409 RepID=UPI0025512499|nr:capsular biosynthesis protein [Rhizobium sp. CNPSo 4039]MDK4713674.1 capsular biosynthesis protein [Rhizobium sp. CNPSo 4039]